MNIDYGINLILSVMPMLYSAINFMMSVVRVEIFTTELDIGRVRTRTRTKIVSVASRL